MRQKLKLAVGRGLAPLLIRWNWRGAKATELSVRDETMSVTGGVIRLRIYTPRVSAAMPMPSSCAETVPAAISLRWPRSKLANYFRA